MMAKKLYILQTSHKLLSDPGTMWDVFLYYNKEYEQPYTGYIGRVYKKSHGVYETNKSSQTFKTKESAANHLYKIENDRGRKTLRERGSWDTKTHPKSTLKSRETAKQRSYLDEKTKHGYHKSYILSRK